MYNEIQNSKNLKNDNDKKYEKHFFLSEMFCYDIKLFEKNIFKKFKTF